MPLLNGYQATMVEWAGAKLSDLRHRMPDAGGLVIAPNIPMAEYMATLIELIEGERPIIVHSQMPNAEVEDQRLPQYGQALDRVGRNDLGRGRHKRLRVLVICRIH